MDDIIKPRKDYELKLEKLLRDKKYKLESDANRFNEKKRTK